MPVISPNETQASYHVVIVGSGAGGGQVAYLLAMEGIKTLVMEAGQMFDPTRETAMFNNRLEPQNKQHITYSHALRSSNANKKSAD